MPTPAPRTTIDGQPGPWGKLLYVPIGIEPPDDCLDTSLGTRPKWIFGSASADAVSQLLRALELDDAALRPLLQQVASHAPGQPIVIKPDPELVMKLEPTPRRQLYSVLATIPGNTQTHPFVLRRDMFNGHLESSGLADSTIKLLSSMLYERERFYLLSDLDTLLPRINDPQERLRLVRTVVRKPTWMVSLKVDKDSNVDELARYWGRGRRSKSLRSLLASAARVPGGCSIDLAHLLPPVPRRLLYSFPAITSDPELVGRDCHWTSFNFFNDPAIYSRESVDQFQANLEHTHSVVTGSPEFGDIVLIGTADKGIIHSAIYLADDMVYTKNGYAPLQPWLVMKLNDMLAYYTVCVPPGAAINYRFFRKNDLNATTQRVELQ